MDVKYSIAILKRETDTETVEHVRTDHWIWHWIDQVPGYATCCTYCGRAGGSLMGVQDVLLYLA